ncbi:hypothetical protein, variant [Aphanomyces invadans]|uniref:PHD-type domain-containing protein n=1 Tax=Aphanomyces invadans TaxID=157072 RepID=A0A024TEV9_9STRA|nr:hypothetical protein, variant [Aphanomyces invadans]ETV91862.1 hypothetical protein, variant [Aphanomyces invadans]|eukprot:XP_008879499.1 hypothetical protein, variant [Aphanomyces invadans]
MAEKPQRESQQGKKRRAEALELEKEAEEWSMPTASGSLGGTRKIRLGKRYQAVLPELRTSPIAHPTSSSSSTDVRGNLPRQIFSADALAESVEPSDLHTYLQFAALLAPGYTHGTSHAMVANALHLLHQHNWNVASASCHLAASHAYTPPPSSPALDASDVPRAKKQQSVPVKHQQWLVSFYLAFAAPSFTEASLESLRALHRTCPLADTATEAAVLSEFLARVDEWTTAAVDVTDAASAAASPPSKPTTKRGSSTPQCTESSSSKAPTSPADLHALLHTATALRCHDLPLVRSITTRLDEFELAKTRLLDVLDACVRPSSKSFTASTTTKKAVNNASATSTSSSKSINLDQLKALHAHVRSFGLAFSEAEAVDGVIAAAEAIRFEIQALLGHEKVSVPAIRDVLAKVDAIPVDLTDDVAPLKVKMTSAQKWLERARKCMPPTKRQSSRITDTSTLANAATHGRSKMHLEAVHELVQCAPVDEASSEVHEMEGLLAYADEWSQRVQAAMAAAVPVDTLRELLEEGEDMPVVMELTTGLKAWIDARKWEATAVGMTSPPNDDNKKQKHDGIVPCSLKCLHELLDESRDIRRRLGPLAESWRPPIERTIQTNVEAAEAWVVQSQQVLGMTTWTKVMGLDKRGPADGRRAKGPAAGGASGVTAGAKRPLADLEAVVNELHSSSVGHPKPELRDETRHVSAELADGKLSSFVDLSEYLSPLEALIDRGKDLLASCAALDLTAANAYVTAVGLVDAMDAFPCRLDQGHALREHVAQAKAWLASVNTVCGKERAAPRSSLTHQVGTPSTRRVSKKSTLYENDVAPVVATTPFPSTSLDDLRALHATALAFSFTDERARMLDEIEAVGAWQNQVRHALASEVAAAALASCQELQALDAARAVQWTTRQATRAGNAEVTPLAAALDDDNVKQAMANVLIDVAPAIETTADRPTSAGDAVPAETVALGDALVNVIQVISGCRTGGQAEGKDASSDGTRLGAVDWTPMLHEIDRALGHIASLDAKEDDECPPVVAEGESTSANERAAVAAIDAWKGQLESVLNALHANVSTAEVVVITWLLHALDWVVSSRSHFVWALDGDASDDDDDGPSLDASIAQGHHLRATCPASLVHDPSMQDGPFVASDPWSHDGSWSRATLWPLEQLERQRDAAKTWEDALEKRLNDRALALHQVAAVLADAAAVHADDRPVWIELKKVKTWLVKVKKVLKSKQTVKLPLHSLGSVVDEGGKVKISTGVFTVLQAHHDAAAAWEAKLKASGLDAGQAKIATLVDLLGEFDARRFVVDMDMHREVLVSATEQYCICRQPYDGFMLGCELCDDWFHDTCVGISKEKAEKVADYVCPSCGLLQELKRLVGVADELSTELLTNESAATYEKALGAALRKVKKEERDVDKSTMALVDLQAQVTAIGQHVSYLEKMAHDAPTSDKPGVLPSLVQHNPLAHHHAMQLFTGYPTPSALVRSLPKFPSSSAATTHGSQQQYLQPMPPPSSQTSPSSHHVNGGGLTLPPLPNATTTSSLHVLLAKPTATQGSTDDAAASSTPSPFPASTSAPTLPPTCPATATASSSQEIELTRFKMEHFKLKQMVVEADAALTQAKERLRLARAAVDNLVTTRDVWRPKAQHWWQQVQFVLTQLVVDKKAFDLRLLKQWAVECEAFCDAFPAVQGMKKVLHAIPWTIDVFALLHGTPKPSYEALENVLRENKVHDAKVLLPLRGVLQRTDQWKARTQKTVAKLLSAKKVDVAKIQAVVNEYLKMPLTCSWGRKLEDLVVALETRDPVLPLPTIEITPPSSPRPSSEALDALVTSAAPPAVSKRKPSGSSRAGGGASRKRVKATDAAPNVVLKMAVSQVTAKGAKGGSRSPAAASVALDAPPR